MNFWEHQEDARRRTKRLIALYVALLLLLALLAGFAFDVIWLAFVQETGFTHSSSAISLFAQPELYLGALALLGLVGLLCLFSPASLSSGGRSVAESLRCTLVPPQAVNSGQRRLLNVVEEMALASGTPVPPVYILENEPGINAFAAGCTINDAVIGVTQGAVDNLTRDELQAVIAHEFSHICNGDMKLDLRFAQLLFGLMCLSDFSGAVLRGVSRSSSGRSRNRDGGKAVAILMMLALVVWLAGVVMAFVGNIIQAAVNRQREFLADASSVQFTRNNALSSALKKIGSLAHGSRLENASMTGSYRHFFFCSIHSGLLDTHPPLDVRIRRIDPQWDGNYPRVDGMPVHMESAPARNASNARAENAWKKLQGRQSVSSAAWLGQVQSGLSNEKPSRTLGDSEALSPAEAESLLREACRDPLEASRMILGLLLDSASAVRSEQLGHIRDGETQRAVLAYCEAFSALHEGDWLPVVEAAIPALKTFSPRQFDDFHRLLTVFINADERVTFKEWILQHLVVTQAGAQFAPKPQAVSGLPSGAAAMVLTALAKLTPKGQARNAFESGARELGLAAPFVDQALNPAKLSESVSALAGCSAGTKEKFMRAAVIVVQHDNRVDTEEALFLRVLSLCLGIPVPHGML